ncbi:MAG: toprim domain-containing protein [archaeon]
MKHNFEIENKYYQKALQHLTIGQVGRNYLKKRGIKEETIEKWEIGWSPYKCIPPNYKDWNDSDKPWPKMWGGITFPIRDENGKIVSISRRLVLQLDKPKYDHYPFQARKIIFGLYQNKKDIQKLGRVLITEGQMDVIMAWQEGLKIVGSTFGAHCSLDHFAVLSRYASTIDILYDGDAAGYKGTKAIKDFPTWGDLIVNLRTGIFKKGEDLDNWIQKNSVEKMFELLNDGKINSLKDRINQLKGLKGGN